VSITLKYLIYILNDQIIFKIVYLTSNEVLHSENMVLNYKNIFFFADRKNHDEPKNNGAINIPKNFA